MRFGLHTLLTIDRSKLRLARLPFRAGLNRVGSMIDERAQIQTADCSISTSQLSAYQFEQTPHGISVVVPVFNSGSTLVRLIDRLEPVLRETGCSFEVILINDGSSDDSWSEIQRLARQRIWIRGIDMMRHYGQHNALLCGIRLAAYDKLVTLDDDLQNPPEDIPKLLARLD